MNNDIFIPNEDSIIRYQAQLTALLKFNGSKKETIDMGRLPELYTALGIADKQLKTNGKTILKALGIEGRNKHNVPMETVENLLSLTYNPEAVFKSLSVSNNPGAYIAVLNTKTEKHEQIIAILSPSRDGHGFTFIPSVYEKHNFERFLGRIHEEQKVLYVKSEGSEIWGQLQSLPRHNPEPSIKNILTKNDIVKQISSLAATGGYPGLNPTTEESGVVANPTETQGSNSLSPEPGEKSSAEIEAARKAGYIQGVCECVAAIGEDHKLGKKLLSEMKVTKDMAKKFANPETYKALEQGIFAQQQKLEQTQSIKR